MDKSSWVTESGIKKAIAILLAVILLSSAIGCYIQHDGGEVLVKRVKFDARGGVQDADLYYPKFTSSQSEKIPIVILSHGGGCTKGVMNTFAIELARRGIAVLNCSSYGAGVSDQPMYDENGYGYGEMKVTAQGLWDAVNYARTLVFVDQTKIGVAGHSQGSYRTGLTVGLDVYYLTLDQLMIQFMYEEFGINFTEDEIKGDAKALAEKYLNADQLAHFNNEYEDVKLSYDTRIFAACGIGSTSNGAEQLFEPREISVAGYTLTGYPQVNQGMFAGTWEGSSATLLSTDFSNRIFGVDQTVDQQWVRTRYPGAEGEILGNLFDAGMQQNEGLRAAVDARQARVIMTPEMTHSRDFFSNEAAANVVAFFVQAFDYNATGIDPLNVTARWKEYANTVAMVAMIGLAAALIALISKKKFFAGITVEQTEEDLVPMSKGMNLIYILLSVAALFFACWRCNHRKPVIINISKFLPLDKTACFLYIYLFFGAVLFIAIIAAFAFINKKKTGSTGLKKLGINIGIKNILKALLASFIVLVLCYLSVSVLLYWFNQDYRWWMCIFTEMKTYHWPMMLRYFIFILPCSFFLAAGTNYNCTVDKSTGFGRFKDMALVIIVGSLGVWLNHVVNMYGCYMLGKELSSASICGGLLMFVPLSAYIYRKTYRVTGSIWTGTFLNAFLIAWSWTSAISITGVYMGATYAEKFFGF